MRNTPMASVLHRVADVLTLCQQFLARVFALIEKVVTGLTEGARQVMAVCGSIAQTAVAATRTVVTTTTRIAQGLFGWIGGWFRRGNGPDPAMA